MRTHTHAHTHTRAHTRTHTHTDEAAARKHARTWSGERGRLALDTQTHTHRNAPHAARKTLLRRPSARRRHERQAVQRAENDLRVRAGAHAAAGASWKRLRPALGRPRPALQRRGVGVEASFRRKHALSLRLFGKLRGRVVRLSVAEVWEIGFKEPQRSSRHASARVRGEGEVRGRGGRVPRRVDLSTAPRIV